MSFGKGVIDRIVFAKLFLECGIFFVVSFLLAVEVGLIAVKLSDVLLEGADELFNFRSKGLILSGRLATD